MALSAGDNTVQTGTMARSIYDALNTEFGAASGQQDTDRKKACAAIAAGVVAHIVALGDVRITTSDGGLQEVSLIPTDAPSSDKVLSGAIE